MIWSQLLFTFKFSLLLKPSCSHPASRPFSALIYKWKDSYNIEYSRKYFEKKQKRAFFSHTTSKRSFALKRRLLQRRLYSRQVSTTCTRRVRMICRGFRTWRFEFDALSRRSKSSVLGQGTFPSVVLVCHPLTMDACWCEQSRNSLSPVVDFNSHSTPMVMFTNFI